MKAIEFYNKYQKRRMLERQLYNESDIVKENSINILKDFEEMDEKAW